MNDPNFAAKSPKGNIALSLIKIKKLHAMSGRGEDIAGK